MPKLSLIANLILVGGIVTAFLAAGGPQKISGFISEQTSQIKSAIGSSNNDDIPRVNVGGGGPVEGPQRRQTTPSRDAERQQSTPNVTINLTGNAQDIATQPREQRRTNQRKIEQSVPQNIRANTSIANSRKTSGPQIKRPTGFSFEEFERGKVTNTSSRFEQTLRKEQERAEALFASLFGNVQKENFATGGKS